MCGFFQSTLVAATPEATAKQEDDCDDCDGVVGTLSEYTSCLLPVSYDVNGLEHGAPILK